MKTDKRAKEVLLQGIEGEEETAKAFQDFMRGEIRSTLWKLMKEEVEMLCGSSHRPEENARYRRAGSDDGVLYFDGTKESIKRPRVREKKAEGSEVEVKLRTYTQARSSKNIEEQIVSFMEEGLSTRSVERVSGQALSASELSRRFVAHSAGRLEELRGRDLSGESYLGLMLDGVFLSGELVVIVALGIGRDGSKKVLDFSSGSTESYEVARGLVARLVERKFKWLGDCMRCLMEQKRCTRR